MLVDVTILPPDEVSTMGAMKNGAFARIEDLAAGYRNGELVYRPYTDGVVINITTPIIWTTDATAMGWQVRILPEGTHIHLFLRRNVDSVVA